MIATVRRHRSILRKNKLHNDLRERIVRALRPRDDLNESPIAMKHSFHIANLLALRPHGRGMAALAPAYRPCRGDRKELLPTTG
jgi:hypothetical protein